MAIFDNGVKTHFGAKGYLDYTLGATDEQRRLYRIRHKNDLTTSVRGRDDRVRGRDDRATRAGNLAYHILWGNSRNIRDNILEYKKMFDV